MAKKTMTVDVEQLKKDIEAMRNAKNDAEANKIMAKYSNAIDDMKNADETPAETKPVEEKKPAKKAPTKVIAPKPETKKAEPKKTEAKAPAKKAEKTESKPATKKAKPKATAKKAAPAAKAAAKPAAKKADAKEAPKGRSYNGKYEIYQTGDSYQYHLKASNGEILFQSETYTSREGIDKAIDALIRNIETGDIKIFADKHGHYKFKLVSKNYRVLAISANYPTEKGATRASESFKNFAVKAEKVDIEYEDADLKTATPIDVNLKDDKDGGKFIVESYNGEFSWDLKASNGQILAQAYGYTSKAGCLNSIETFKKNVLEGTFKCVKDKNGNYAYKLYSLAGRVTVVGEAYPSKTSAESAAQSVASFYKNAVIEELPVEK